MAVNSAAPQGFITEQIVCVEEIL